MNYKFQFLSFAFLLNLIIWTGCDGEKNDVLIITKGINDPPVLYAIRKLEKRLTELGCVIHYEKKNSPADWYEISIGSYTVDTLIQERLVQKNLTLSDEPESSVIYHDKNELILSGSDAVGTMYAILEAKDMLPLKNGPLYQNIKDSNISAEVRERAVSIYTMHRRSWEEKLYDEEYWTKYFDLLVESRINSFVVIFGYENGGFLAPVYPYFFDIDQFPNVKMIGLSPEQQQKNTRAFTRIIELAHERGIKFTPGIWDHIYRAGVQGGGITGMNIVPDQPVEGLVWGLDATNLAAYTKLALMKFVKTFPEIDGIQFRMHWESGLTREETPQFWGEIFDMLQNEMPGLSIDLRTKDLPNEVIQDAIDKNLNFRLTTKYWMEQMGLPFHPMHINRENQFERRHGYADLLTYPKKYNLHWRLWNGGTARILLWGDPDYVTRFVESTRLYGGNSFEINEPLATKMEAQPHDMKPFALLNESSQYYEYEFERYWYFFKLWGRLAYNPTMDQAYFSRQFSDRFGASGAAIRKGLHLASKVLPRIVASAYHYRFFPTTRGWVEKMRMEDLPEFAKAEATDIQLFTSASEEADLLMNRVETAKVRSMDNSKWFQRISDSIFQQIDLANAAVTNSSSKEYVSTITDLQILANLAAYYAHRIPGAVYYNIFLQSNNLNYFERAISEEKMAIDSWQALVDAAGTKYSDDLRMGFCEGNMCGHWRDELVKLKAGLKVLESNRDSLTQHSQGIDQENIWISTHDDQQAPEVSIVAPSTAIPFQPLVVAAEAEDDSGIKWLRLRYRHLTQFEDYQTVEMTPDASGNNYKATIPADFLDPQWDLMYFIEAMDIHGNGMIYPDFEKEMPYVVVELDR